MNELNHLQHDELVKWQDRALKAEATNREQKAEIERLNLIIESPSITEIRKSRMITELETELASLRASVGEKPEDAWKRAQRQILEKVYWSTGWDVDEEMPEIQPYVAPTLPGEEK